MADFIIERLLSLSPAIEYMAVFWALSAIYALASNHLLSFREEMGMYTLALKLTAVSLVAVGIWLIS